MGPVLISNRCFPFSTSFGNVQHTGKVQWSAWNSDETLHTLYRSNTQRPPSLRCAGGTKDTVRSRNGIRVRSFILWNPPVIEVHPHISVVKLDLFGKDRQPQKVRSIHPCHQVFGTQVHKGAMVSGNESERPHSSANRPFEERLPHL